MHAWRVKPNQLGEHVQQVSTNMLLLVLASVLLVGTVHGAAYDRLVVLLPMVAGVMLVGCLLGIAWRQRPSYRPVFEMPVIMY